MALLPGIDSVCAVTGTSSLPAPPPQKRKAISAAHPYLYHLCQHCLYDVGGLLWCI